MSLFPTPDARPAVVVPLAGADADAVLAHAREVAASGADVAEWRLDTWGAHDGEGALEMLPALRSALGSLPVLATYRSLAEGGPGGLDDAGYTALLLALVAARVEGVDVELSRPDAVATAITTAARDAGTVVVGSSHDFAGTPSTDRLGAILDSLAARDADVLKVAVTASDGGDVARLLAAAHTARRHGRPVLPIAMGPAGVLTRIAGECWGAPATFGLVGTGSAPGQVPVPELRDALDAIHDALTAADGPVSAVTA
ncbi:type I 3-dehydroquinate dehydratase [Serinibacter arcticus]|uniref:3-dehydroquinate dehydratase n=1 Tax=Serinibacter arcticus TaxID=1655435 RepID=A0A2U1ZRU9_9MICO|nr:type I 3-dehydroquinate dehydratase [Serinibacter arcticus]PWD49708.1 type I 3-dehydroquinate dehydratase [Serinibacter arcticus]